jgi:hypothetical protein
MVVCYCSKYVVKWVNPIKQNSVVLLFFLSEFATKKGDKK